MLPQSKKKKADASELDQRLRALTAGSDPAQDNKKPSGVAKVVEEQKQNFKNHRQNIQNQTNNLTKQPTASPVAAAQSSAPAETIDLPATQKEASTPAEPNAAAGGQKGTSQLQASSGKPEEKKAPAVEVQPLGKQAEPAKKETADVVGQAQAAEPTTGSNQLAAPLAPSLSKQRSQAQAPKPVAETASASLEVPEPPMLKKEVSSIGDDADTLLLSPPQLITRPSNMPTKKDNQNAPNQTQSKQNEGPAKEKDAAKAKPVDAGKSKAETFEEKKEDAAAAEAIRTDESKNVKSGQTDKFGKAPQIVVTEPSDGMTLGEQIATEMSVNQNMPFSKLDISSIENPPEAFLDSHISKDQLRIVQAAHGLEKDELGDVSFNAQLQSPQSKTTQFDVQTSTGQNYAIKISLEAHQQYLVSIVDKSSKAQVCSKLKIPDEFIADSVLGDHPNKLVVLRLAIEEKIEQLGQVTASAGQLNIFTDKSDKKPVNVTQEFSASRLSGGDKENLADDNVSEQPVGSARNQLAIQDSKKRDSKAQQEYEQLKKQLSTNAPLKKFEEHKLNTKNEMVKGDLLVRLQELAHNVLLNRSYNSTALVLITLDLQERFLNEFDDFKELIYPKVVAKLDQLLRVLQPGSMQENQVEQTTQSHDFHEVKEWLKKFLVREEMTEALAKRVIEGKVELDKPTEPDEQKETETVEVVQAPPPKPKEFVDMSDLTGVLRSVLDYQFRQTTVGDQDDNLAESQKQGAEGKDEVKVAGGSKPVSDTYDPLSEEKNRDFSLQFLTRFILKGYTGQNQVDITDADFAISDKNNLRWAGIVKENKEQVQQKARCETDESSTRPSNILLYKTLFCSFTLNLRLLALKKLSLEDPATGGIGHIPAQFVCKFKFYNFEQTESDVLFFDPLAPADSVQIPILVQSPKIEPQSCSFSFTVEQDIHRFVDYMFARKLRLCLYTAHSDILFAQCEIDLQQVLTCAKQLEFFQVPLYECQDLSNLVPQPQNASAAAESVLQLEKQPFAHLQFATGTYCKPLVDPLKLRPGAGGMVLEDKVDPTLKIRGKANLEVGKSEVLLATGAKPTCEEYVNSTEAFQLRLFEQVRKKVRVGASKYKASLEAHDENGSRKPMRDDPFAALELGEDHFLKTWLQESEFYRNQLKQQAIKERIYQGNSEIVNIKVYAGLPFFFNVMARNEENFDQTFKVEVFDQNVALGSEQPDQKSLLLKIITDERDQKFLEKQGVLAQNGAEKCADTSVFTKLKDGKLLLSLGPRKSCNFLVKYLAFDTTPRNYLIRLTKLVDKYDLGRSFQIKVNMDKEVNFHGNSSVQQVQTLPPDRTVHVSYDPREPLAVRLPGNQLWPEQTKISPPGVLFRKPEGTLGSMNQDKRHKDEAPREFQVFEYSDHDRHILKRFTLLTIEPAFEAPAIKLQARGTYEGALDLESPAERDVFNIRCQFAQLSRDLQIQIGQIVPKEATNQPGQPITHWTVPFKLVVDKSKTVGEPEVTRTLHLSFIDVTSLDVNNHTIFAKHILKIDTSAVFPNMTLEARKQAKAESVKRQEVAKKKSDLPVRVAQPAAVNASENECQAAPEQAVEQSQVKDGSVHVHLKKPGALTIEHKYIVPGHDKNKVRKISFCSSRPQLLQLIGPPERECKSGDTVALKLMFYNRQTGRQSQTTQKPIQIMLFINELESVDDADDDADSFAFQESDNEAAGNQVSTAEDQDLVGDKIVFTVSYSATSAASKRLETAQRAESGDVDSATGELIQAV